MNGKNQTSGTMNLPVDIGEILLEIEPIIVNNKELDTQLVPPAFQSVRNRKVYNFSYSHDEGYIGHSELVAHQPLPIREKLFEHAKDTKDLLLVALRDDEVALLWRSDQGEPPVLTEVWAGTR